VQAHLTSQLGGGGDVGVGVGGRGQKGTHTSLRMTVAHFAHLQKNVSWPLQSQLLTLQAVLPYMFVADRLRSNTHPSTTDTPGTAQPTNP
jgi:hypothetical protein